MGRGGRFPVEFMVRAIMECKPVKALKGKLSQCLGRMEVGELRTLCLVLIVSMLLVDVILIVRGGDRSRAAPHYSAIRPAITVSGERRQVSVKAFRVVWDSLMADPATERKWDSLLRLRPGLADTIKELKKMDSAAWER